MSSSPLSFDPRNELLYQQSLEKPSINGAFLKLLIHNPETPAVIQLTDMIEGSDSSRATARRVTEEHVGLLALALYRRAAPSLPVPKAMRLPSSQDFRPSEPNNPFTVLTNDTYGRFADVAFTTLPVDEKTADLVRNRDDQEIQTANVVRIGLSARLRFGTEWIPSDVETIIAVRENPKSLSLAIKSMRSPEVKKALMEAKKAVKRRAA